MSLLPLLSGCSAAPATAQSAPAEPTAMPTSPVRAPVQTVARPESTPSRPVQSAPGPLVPPYAAPAADARLVIPNLGIDAPLVPVGVSAEGEVESPANAEVVGWYNLSPAPGSRGNSILVGHVDWRGSQAVFWRLREMRPGDLIELRGGQRVVATFEVEWVQSFHVSAAPLDAIFSSTREGKVTLITCEGAFDPATRNYLQRLVVRAAYVAP